MKCEGIRDTSMCGTLVVHSLGSAKSDGKGRDGGKAQGKSTGKSGKGGGKKGAGKAQGEEVQEIPEAQARGGCQGECWRRGLCRAQSGSVHLISGGEERGGFLDTEEEGKKLSKRKLPGARGENAGGSARDVWRHSDLTDVVNFHAEQAAEC